MPFDARSIKEFFDKKTTPLELENQPCKKKHSKKHTLP